MWKYICTALILLCQHSLSAQTQASLTETLVTGTWHVTRWETENRLLDFEDTVASFNYMVERLKQENKVQTISKTDSLKIRSKVRQVLPAAEGLRFWLMFNKDKTFTWARTNSDTAATYKGTYSLSSATNEIILTSVDGRTNAYQKMTLKLHAIHPNELVIEIPSEEVGMKQSKFTLKRM